jgi:hypothetical protein
MCRRAHPRIPRIRPGEGGQTVHFSTYPMQYTFTGFLIRALREFQNTYFNIFHMMPIPYSVF